MHLKSLVEDRHDTGQSLFRSSSKPPSKPHPTLTIPNTLFTPHTTPHNPQHPLHSSHDTAHPTLTILQTPHCLLLNTSPLTPYRSPFTPLPLSPSPLAAGGTNLALHKPVKSSSQWGSRGGPGTLTDGQVPPNKKWDYNKCLCTRKDRDGPWVSGDRMREIL